MAGAPGKAVAMLVRGQRVAVTIKVSRAARDPSRRGLPLRIDGAEGGEGIDPILLPRPSGRFCGVDSHCSRQQAGLGLAIGTHIGTRHRGAVPEGEPRGKGLHLQRDPAVAVTAGGRPARSRAK